MLENYTIVTLTHAQAVDLIATSEPAETRIDTGAVVTSKLNHPQFGTLVLVENAVGLSSVLATRKAVQQMSARLLQSIAD